MKSKIELSLFTVATVTAIIAPMHEALKFLSIITLLICLVYLFAGWYLLRESKPNAFQLLPLVIGFFFASSLLSTIFVARLYPGGAYFTWYSILGDIALIVFLGLNKAKLPKSRTRIMLQLCIMAIVSGLTYYL